MAVPKRKTSKARRDKRRSHEALSLPTFTACTKCNDMVRPHHVCEHCGTYNGRKVLDIKE